MTSTCFRLYTLVTFLTISLVAGSVCLVQGTYCQSFCSHIIYVDGSAELLRIIDCSYKEQQSVDSCLHMPSLSL